MQTGVETPHPGVVTDAAKSRLLVVDDERAQMRALCDTLAQEGYSTLGFASPRQALEQFRAGDFDLLITDLMMPEMDGLALSAEARRIDPELVAIVMTGHGTVDTAVRAMQDGAIDYILKPFKLNAILAAVARALETQHLRRECARMRERERQRTEELALANRDLESYSYSISHDLRAPLRAINSFAQILEEDYAEALGVEVRDIVGTIRRSTRTMDQLIVGLLEFSRATNETRKLNTGPVDMASLADAAAREAVVLHTGTQPKIEIGDLPDAVGDATVLRQVWCNLIGNALKYSAQKAEPRVTVAGRLEGDEAIYSVRDNGAGFDMRYVDKLFGVFQRLHRSEEFAGAGVGLAIVQRIITRHGGRIWAEGVPNEGACFQFALPVAGTREKPATELPS